MSLPAPEAPNTFPVEEVLAAGQLSEETFLLLSDLRVRRMPEDQQGPFIVDRFIGAVVAQHQSGIFETSTGSAVSPRDVLAAVDSVASGEDPKESLSYITKTGGLRAAAYLLAHDPRTGELLGRIMGRLEFDQADQPVFTSLAQLEGYLYGLTGGLAADWQPTVLAEVAEYASKTGDSPRAHWQLTVKSSLRSSDIPGVRETQAAWDGAESAAQAAGMDVGLLERSADRIRTMVQAQGDAGRVAVSDVEPPSPTYDYLFQ